MDVYRTFSHARVSRRHLRAAVIFYGSRISLELLRGKLLALRDSFGAAFENANYSLEFVFIEVNESAH